MGIYDVIVLGGGPAGLTAGIYAVRAGLKTLLLEKSFLGGQAATTFLIENYPGFPEGVSGPELIERMRQQVERLGVEVRFAEVERIEKEKAGFRLKLPDEVLSTKAVIIATGARPATLDIPGEARLRGRGVSYCATCDGAFFRDEPLAVIGGGNSAVEEANFLTRFASKVYVIHRRDKLRAEKIIQERAFANPKIEFVWNSVAVEIRGEDKVEGVLIKNVHTGKTKELQVAGVFIYVGLKPHTDFLQGFVQLDEAGFIVTDENMHTSEPGILAAGDVRHKAVRQIATAVGDGAVAAVMAQKYLEEY